MRTAALLAFTAALISAGAAAARPATQASRSCPDDVPHAATRVLTSYEADGRRVQAYLYSPRAPNGAGIVLLPGAGGFDSDAPLFDPFAIQLASRGYYVLIADYFSARAPGARRGPQTLTAWGRGAVDGARFIAAQPGADPDRVALWGFSLGAYVAVEGASAAPAADGPAAAIGVASASDAGPLAVGGRPVPVLFVHATRDPYLSERSIRRWAEAFEAKGAPVEVQMIDHRGHGFDQAGWCDVFSRTRGFFLDRTLGAEALDGQ